MIKSYFKNGKKLYEVAVHVKDSRRKQHCRKKKGITSERKAREIEFQLKNELNQLISGNCTRWTWKGWHQECLNRMKPTLKKSTIKNYDRRLKKWLPKEFLEQPLNKISTQDIHELLFNTIGDMASQQSKKIILKMIKRNAVSLSPSPCHH